MQQGRKTSPQQQKGDHKPDVQELTHEHFCSLTAHTQLSAWCQLESGDWQGRHTYVPGSLHSLTSMAL